MWTASPTSSTTTSPTSPKPTSTASAEPPAPARSKRPEIPLALDAIVMKMLSKNPEERYAQMNPVVPAAFHFCEIGKAYRTRDLVDAAIKMQREREMEKSQARALDAAECSRLAARALAATSAADVRRLA